MRANERTDKQVAQYLHLCSFLFSTIVYLFVSGERECGIHESIQRRQHGLLQSVREETFQLGPRRIAAVSHPRRILDSNRAEGCCSIPSTSNTRWQPCGRLTTDDAIDDDSMATVFLDLPFEGMEAHSNVATFSCKEFLIRLSTNELPWPWSLITLHLITQ